MFSTAYRLQPARFRGIGLAVALIATKSTDDGFNEITATRIIDSTSNSGFGKCYRLPSSIRKLKHRPIRLPRNAIVPRR